jgi:hypothetical protein
MSAQPAELRQRFLFACASVFLIAASPKWGLRDHLGRMFDVSISPKFSLARLECMAGTTGEPLEQAQMVLTIACQ